MHISERILGGGVTPLLCWDFPSTKKELVHSARRVQGTQESGLRSLLNVNEESAYRSWAPKSPLICILTRLYRRADTRLAKKNLSRSLLSEAVKMHISEWILGGGVTPLLCWDFPSTKKELVHSARRVQGTQESGLRSLLNVNEESAYRSVTR